MNRQEQRWTRTNYDKVPTSEGQLSIKNPDLRNYLGRLGKNEKEDLENNLKRTAGLDWHVFESEFLEDEEETGNLVKILNEYFTVPEEGNKKSRERIIKGKLIPFLNN
jgi:hypothetical protein